MSEDVGAPAVLMLAAGRGKRLGADAPERPKVLIPFGGRTLLERHLERLDRAGAGPVTLVVGYQAAQIAAELDRLGRRDVRLLENPDWHEGSVVSLWRGLDVLEGGTPALLMDADVIYGQALLDRLVRSRFAAALLLDRELEPGDEPVKICVDDDGRMVDFAKRPEAAHAWHGESVGFFRFAPAAATRLAARVRALVEAGERGIEYEEPIRSLIREDKAGMFGYEDITGLPWTEIDFVEDVRKAEALLPLLQEVSA
ncbi:MAG: phosphocholine cytidylyltransferase family protein [Gluconacetobacter diazotrophicus]|nr:phosphocholine cytidylyltransferase family protein [Gluconacetobacter diazotrophicus]